jgi:hypothetical protein
MFKYTASRFRLNLTRRYFSDNLSLTDVQYLANHIDKIFSYWFRWSDRNCPSSEVDS